MNSAYCYAWMLRSLCYSYSTLLLEEQGTGVLHLVQVKFKRALS